MQEENGNAKEKENGGNRFKYILISVGAVFCAVIIFFSGWFGHYLSLDGRLRAFLWAVDQTDMHYYKGLNKDVLYDSVFDALYQQIDEYSAFYTAEEYATIERESRGENLGIGVTFLKAQSGLVQVYSVVENSPAQKAGIKRGMYVLAYGKTADALTPSQNYQDVLDFIRTQTGQFVLRCSYQSDGSEGVNFTVARKSYLAAFVSYRDSESGFSFRGTDQLVLTEDDGQKLVGLDDKTAYVRLDSFTGNAQGEFYACLQMMKARNRSNLVLDLRGNGGGYMDVLSGISSYLIKSGEEKHPAIATAKYKDGKTFDFTADKSTFSTFFGAESNVYVLADDGTASASECLLGAMLDYGTLPIANVFLQKTAAEHTARTYGKGIMQTYYRSITGDVMKLTSATIHWPKSGKCIHGVGVTETDGAQSIVAPAVEKEDTFLTQLIARLFS